MKYNGFNMPRTSERRAASQNGVGNIPQIVPINVIFTGIEFKECDFNALPSIIILSPSNPFDLCMSGLSF